MIMLLTLFVFACGSTKTVVKPPPFRIVETTLAKDIRILIKRVRENQNESLRLRYIIDSLSG